MTSHLTTPGGGPACGAAPTLFDSPEPDNVTCGRCRRTIKFRRAVGHAATDGAPRALRKPSESALSGSAHLERAGREPDGPKRLLSRRGPGVSPGGAERFEAP